MAKDRPNKIPRPRTIARHYSEGRYCDYPADIIFSSINSFDYDYNPTAIPIQLGFKQMFVADFKAFVYLCEHKDEIDMDSFINDANGFMESKGIELPVPMNDIMPRIMVAMLEEDMLSALRSPDSQSVCMLIYTGDEKSWKYRHPERYDPAFMKRGSVYIPGSVPSFFEDEELRSAGFNVDMGVNLLFISQFFSA